MSTSVSTSSTNSNSFRGKNRRLRGWVTAIGAILMIFFLALVVRLQGYVSGTEFSPTHFQQREFRFYEIPILHLQITPIKRSGVTPAAALYVRSNSLITPHTGAPKTWHLVSISRGMTGSTPAGAQLLVEQLLLEFNDEPYWKTWSKDHPQSANVLWPVIQRLAERELYVLMPAIFELAQASQTSQELQRAIDQSLREEYLALVDDMRAADRNELADLLLDEAIKDYPQDADLKKLRRNPTTSSQQG